MYIEQEYGCGMNPVKDQTGVFVLAPGMIAHFRERYYLGEYASDPSNFSQIIQQLEKKYMGRDYDMVNNNCNHFSAELLNHMVDIHIYIYSLCTPVVCHFHMISVIYNIYVNL